MEAAGVLYRCKQRMGKSIPEEDLTAGKLGQYLKPEDYHPVKQVSNFSNTFVMALPVLNVPGSAPSPPVPPLPPSLLAHSFFVTFRKTRLHWSKVKQQLTKLCK